MALVEDTIASSVAADWATIGAWAADVSTRVAGNEYRGTIIDDSDYDEAVTLDFGGAANNNDSYQWLNVAAANRHPGFRPDPTRARISYSGGATAALDIQSRFARVSGLQIHRPASGSMLNSDEGVRVRNTVNVLLENSIIGTDDLGATNNSDGLYLGNWGVSNLCLFQCVIYGWHRGAVHGQQFQAGAFDHNVFADFCAFMGAGVGADEAVVLFVNESTSAGAHSSFQPRGTWFSNPLGAGFDMRLNADTGPATVDAIGFHCAHQHSSTSLVGTPLPTETWNVSQDAVDGLVDTPAPTAGIHIANADQTGVNLDWTPVNDPNNVLIGNAIDYSGTPIDVRIDYSRDMTGALRPATNLTIGPVEAAPVTPSAWSARVHDGTQWNDHTVRVHDGTQWNDHDIDVT